MPKLADSLMLQVHACVLGMTHPTGYPSWVMLSHLFTYLPLGDCAYRVNLSSAVYAATAVALVYVAGLLLSRRVAAAAAGALAFGLGKTFWSQAVIAEVYTLNSLVVALAIVFLLLWQIKRRDGYLLLAAFSIGLSLTNNVTSGLLLPAAFLFVAAVDLHKLVEWRLVVKGAGAFLLGLAPYLYLPIRASMNPPLNANDPDSLGRFWFVVSGGNLRGGFFDFGPATLPGRFALYGEHLLNDFGPWLLAAGAIGLLALLLRNRPVALLTGSLFLGWLIFALENDIPDVFVYFIPTYLMVALWISSGLGALLAGAEALVAGLPRVSRGAVLAALSSLLVLLPLLGAERAYARVDMSQYYRGQRMMETVAENTAPGATVLQHRSVLWYMVLVEERRQDLTLVDPFQHTLKSPSNDVVWPGDFSASDMDRLYGTDDRTGVTAAEKAAERGPVYVFTRRDEVIVNLRHAGFRVIPVGKPLYKLVPTAKKTGA